MANAQVGITVLADTKKAIKSFEDLEKSEKKVTQALSELDGKQATTLQNMQMGLLAANTAMLKFNAALMALDIGMNLVESFNNVIEKLDPSIRNAAAAMKEFEKAGMSAFGLAAEAFSSEEGPAASAAKMGEHAEKASKRVSGAIDEMVEDLRLASVYASDQMAKAWMGVEPPIANVWENVTGINEALAKTPSLIQLAASAAEVWRRATDPGSSGGLLGLGMAMDKRFGKDQARANKEAEAAAKRARAEQLASAAALQSGALLQDPSTAEKIAAITEAMAANWDQDEAFNVRVGGGILGGVNNQRANPFGGFLGDVNKIAEDAKTTQSVLDSLADSASMAGGAFAALQAGAVAAFDAAITGGEGMAAAFKKAVASSLRSTAIHAAIKALWEGAEAIAALAGGNLPGAAAHGIAAAKYTATAVAAGAAAAAMGGFGGGGGTAGGGGGSGGGGGTGFTAPSRDHRGDGQTIIVQVAADYGDADDLAEKIDQRLRMGERRGVIRSRSVPGPVRFKS